MTISQKDIKLLWGRSGNRCAKCRIELTQNSNAITSSFTLGEQAHIVGEKENTTRGRSPLSIEERNSYHNLILLCPNHHSEIDSNEEDWPIEKLHQLKSKHELWVNETLSKVVDLEKSAKQIVVSGVIDFTVILCELETWRFWSSEALSADPKWTKERVENTYRYRQKIIATIWPEEFDELRRSAITLSIFLGRAANVFMEHMESIEDFYIAHRFYKAKSFNPNFNKDVKAFEDWLDRCYEMVFLSTKAANWFADTVRRDINPMFFAEHGKFTIFDGPHADPITRISLPEFTSQEKQRFPDAAHTYSEL
jgi:hypothetical protein